MTGSWKTTVAGLVSAAAAFVLFAHTSFNIMFPQWALALATFTTVGGLAALGVAAKDSNVTGGTVGQPSTPQALADANQAPAIPLQNANMPLNPFVISHTASSDPGFTTPANPADIKAQAAEKSHNIGAK